MIKAILSRIFTFGKEMVIYIRFLFLLAVFVFRSLVEWANRITKSRLTKMVDVIERLEEKVDMKTEGDVSRIYLIELAFRNMKTKKTRAVVTIGGVAVGVGAIVFLVSVGYGLEKLVISKVTRLEELRMIDISKVGANEVRMNEEAISKIKSIKGTVDVVPMISLVAKINYKNSIIDLMSMGIDERYIKANQVKIVAGSEFKDKDSDYYFDKKESKVLGINEEIVSAEFGGKTGGGLSRVNIPIGQKAGLWQECSLGSEMLGVVIRSNGGYVGEEVWGEKYYIDSENTEVVGEDYITGKQLSKWYRVKAPLWKIDEDNNPVPMLNSYGKRIWETGCLLGSEVVVEEDKWLKNIADSLDGFLNEGKVLGVTKTATGSAYTGTNQNTAIGNTELFEVVVATDSAGMEWVELKKKGEITQEQKDVIFEGEPAKEAYVSMGMLKLFGLNKETAIGEKFKVMYIISENLLPGSSGSLLSEETEYTIKGVSDDETSNYYYFQIADAKRLGIVDYSQLKLLAESEQTVTGIRKEVETMGFKTASTLDTVNQIEGLFNTLRLLLGLLGTVGLSVAALGMFNTMTVSLLERTREVGAMKAMGMLSNEVGELFLAESMIMGVGGGVAGVGLGLVLGKLLSLILSAISVIKGQGVIDISFVPWFFIVFIMSISFFVGIVTGWYPSRRARLISALDALRYE